MGGLLFGYDFVVIGGAKPFYEAFFNIADQATLQGWAMSSALVGCIAGALCAGKLSDVYGRKPMLIVAAFLFIISAVGTGWADGFSAFIVYRIIGGAGIGIASNISPMYIAEISPPNLRGRFVSLNQMTIVLGILAAQITNMLIAQDVPSDADISFIKDSWNGQTGWRWMFWAENVPAVAFFFCAFLIPESPRWLATRGFKEKSISILKKIGGASYATRAYDEIRELLTLHKQEAQGGIKAVFAPSMRNVLLIGIVLAVFQQWCGINVIFNYAEEIFKAAGYGINDMLFNIMLTGITNVVFTLVGIYAVDKIGRKPLLLLGASMLFVIYILMGGCYFFDVKGWTPLILVVLAIGSYAMTLAPVMWVVISEIFPNAIRGTAMSIAVLTLWIACSTLTQTFPMMNKALGISGTFWVYSGICLLGFLFILIKVPETKGKSLEEIEKELIKD